MLKKRFLGPHLCWQRSPLGPHLTRNWVPITNKIGSPWHGTWEQCLWVIWVVQDGIDCRAQFGCWCLKEKNSLFVCLFILPSLATAAVELSSILSGWD